MSSLDRRSAGILLHPTSLPGPYGVGDLGREAHRCVEWLANARQSWWQMLPVGPPAAGDSPYMAYSAFAGSPLLINLEKLRDDGLLTDEDVRPPADAPAHAPAAAKGGSAHHEPAKADFAAAARWKLPRLRKAFEVFDARRRPDEVAAFEEFCRDNEAWLAPWALYSALKEARNDEPWFAWRPDLRNSAGEGVRLAWDLLTRPVRQHQFVQWLFQRQWDELRAACRKAGVGLIGDVPIFVAHDSADVWARQDIFHLGADGRPTVVAGVPPDYFSADGQLWGNPLYRWDVLREKNYDWWMQRLQRAGRLFDAVRLDHFIGFHRCWQVPGNATNARGGQFVPGPGEHFFQAVRRSVGHLQLIAEDLGLLTPEVERLRDGSGLPGMRVMHFSFTLDDKYAMQRPHAYPRNCVVYTGTHDNDTTVGWLHDVGPESGPGAKPQARAERDLARRYIGSTDNGRFHWDMIRSAYVSAGNTVIIPMQDVLGLDTRSRMNTPGTATGNWRWRLGEGQATAEVAGRLREFCELFGRLPTG